MLSRAEHGTAENGAKVELGIVEHNGREFSALGSVVDEQNGRLIGYVRSTKPASDHIADRVQACELTTWDGKQTICMLRVVGRVRLAQWSPIGGRYLYCYRATLNGRSYYGRGFGDGMLLRLRACKQREVRK